MKKTTLRLFFLLCVFLCLSSAVFGMDRDTIRTQIRWFAVDISTETDKQTWTNAILNQRIEMAQDDIVAKTRCIKGRADADTVALQREYALPDDLLVIERVSYFIESSTSAYKRLGYKTYAGLDVSNSEWEDEYTGSEPEYYYERKNLIGIEPRPSSTYAGTDYLRVDYVVRPSSLTADSSVPLNGIYSLYPYHELMIWYVVSLCKLDEGSYADSEWYWKRYLTGIVQMKEDLANRPDKEGAIQVRRRP